LTEVIALASHDFPALNDAVSPTVGRAFHPCEESSIMDDSKAAEILKSLAAGLDPAAGQPLTDLGPLQSPDVVRALFLAADSLESRLRQSRRLSTLPRNAGKPWSVDEDERLLAGFDAGGKVDELAAAHERTRAGIEARLVKRGRLEADQAPAARIR
jgi:hypothetical protein